MHPGSNTNSWHFIVMKLSIIIPVYNVEEYIEKCILSLEQQDIPKEEYEIIIINDGSPDNSREVILNLVNQFSNIVFIEQENKGVSLARNAGMDKATGKYLLFIDPDDYVEQNSFTRLLDTAGQYNAQVSFLGYRFLNADNTVRKDVLFAELQGRIYKGIDVYSVSRGDGTVDPDRSWAILFEREFINKHQLRMLPGVPYLEDGEFLARLLCLTDRAIFDSSIFYYRTTRAGSATNSMLFYSDKAIEGFIKAADNLYKFRQNAMLVKQQQIFLNQPVCKFVLLAVDSSLRNQESLELKDVTGRLDKIGIKKCELTGCNKYYRRDGFFFNVSPVLYSLYKPLWSIVDNIYFRLFKVHP